MNKRYQVFISSTFEDLKEERQNVFKAILDLEHMPAGMEMFPATDDEAWEFIKEVIDLSDYYVLIIGGRYGSMDESLISFTEKEYDYAFNSKKPVIALLHEDPDSLPRAKTETSTDAWKKLIDFREKVTSRHTCVFWKNPEELKAFLILGLTKTIKKNPAVGWIRANQASSDESLKEILHLRKIIQDLELQLNSDSFGKPNNIEELSHGEDVFDIDCSFQLSGDLFDDDGNWTYDEKDYTATLTVTWNQLWGGISPKLIHDATIDDLKSALKEFLKELGKDFWIADSGLEDAELEFFDLADSVYDTVFVQFRALGMMKESSKTRSVKDKNSYWSLTKYGDSLMNNLRALKRDSRVAMVRSSKAKPITL